MKEYVENMKEYVKNVKEYEEICQHLSDILFPIKLWLFIILYLN